PHSLSFPTRRSSDLVYCKLSGLVTEADWTNWRAEHFKPYLDVVLENFGIDRLMFGSDWPVCLLAGSYARVKALIDGYTRELPARSEEHTSELQSRGH